MTIPKRPKHYVSGWSFWDNELMTHEHAVAVRAVEALTGEQYPSCTCDSAYKNRELQDPNCNYCDQEELRAALREIEASGWKP